MNLELNEKFSVIVWRSILILVVLLLLTNYGCSSKNTSDKKSIQDSTLLTLDQLASGVWVCTQQLSQSYAEKNIHETTYLLFGDGDEAGTVELCEGSGLNRGCITNGKFILNNDKKSVEISDVTNNNCLWLSNLNGTGTYNKKVDMLTFKTLYGTVIFKHE